MTTNLNALAQNISELVELEKNAKPISNLKELHERIATRNKIIALKDELASAIEDISASVYRLPRLPGPEYVEWADAVLAMNPVFLVLDTTGLDRNCDIIRFSIFDVNGCLWDSVVKPGRRMDPNTNYTGLDMTALEVAPSLKEVWSSVQQILRGRYVLSWGKEFVDDRLQENAEHYGLEPIKLIGACLQRKTSDYYSVYSIRLTTTCQKIGHDLPQISGAPMRALGQISILKAMSQGITDVQREAASTSDDDEDDHPF